jgi:hypothetical protein
LLASVCVRARLRGLVPVACAAVPVARALVPVTKVRLLRRPRPATVAAVSKTLVAPASSTLVAPALIPTPLIPEL